MRPLPATALAGALLWSTACGTPLDALSQEFLTVNTFGDDGRVKFVPPTDGYCDSYPDVVLELNGAQATSDRYGGGMALGGIGLTPYCAGLYGRVRNAVGQMLGPVEVRASWEGEELSARFADQTRRSLELPEEVVEGQEIRGSLSLPVDLLTNVPVHGGGPEEPVHLEFFPQWETDSYYRVMLDEDAIRERNELVGTLGDDIVPGVYDVSIETHRLSAPVEQCSFRGCQLDVSIEGLTVTVGAN